MGNENVCIIDYGSGNVRSVYNVFRALTAKVTVSNSPDDLAAATHIVLPGVGAFGAAMEKITALGIVPLLEEEVLKGGKPFLGICVGMQVLADTGYEYGEHRGLGWIGGAVRKMEVGELPLPHVGWNDLEIMRPSPLLEGIDGQVDFYFVHSYHFEALDPVHVCARFSYGGDHACVIRRENIHGVQFHPEKSQKAGKRLLENFLRLS